MLVPVNRCVRRGLFRTAVHERSNLGGRAPRRRATLTMADDWQSAFTEAEYDAIILGTGMKECLISGLLSVEGKKVRSEFRVWSKKSGKEEHVARARLVVLVTISALHTHPSSVFANSCER